MSMLSVDRSLSKDILIRGIQMGSRLGSTGRRIGKIKDVH
jgi:hypothetical protein